MTQDVKERMETLVIDLNCLAGNLQFIHEAMDGLQCEAVYCAAHVARSLAVEAELLAKEITQI